MAGMSHAGVVRVEHGAIAVCAAVIAAFIPLWFVGSEAQAAGGATGVAANAVAPAGSMLATSVGKVERLQGAGDSVGEVSAPARAIPAVVAPAERIAPRALTQLAEPAGPAAFAAVAPPAGTAAAESVAIAPAGPPPDLSHTPSGWYTPVATYYFSARFGVSGSWSSGHHTGLDFVTKDRTPIRSATDGVVVAASSAGAYGNLLQIKIGPKTEIWMAHLAKFLVKKGDVVKAGQVVGKVGMTGNTTGPHCHFEVRVKDKPKNPEPYFWPDGQSVTRIKR